MYLIPVWVSWTELISSVSNCINAPYVTPCGWTQESNQSLIHLWNSSSVPSTFCLLILTEGMLCSLEHSVWSSFQDFFWGRGEGFRDYPRFKFSKRPPDMPRCGLVWLSRIAETIHSVAAKLILNSLTLPVSALIVKCLEENCLRLRL
jgi:hypothetical protein